MARATITGDQNAGQPCQIGYTQAMMRNTNARQSTLSLQRRICLSVLYCTDCNGLGRIKAEASLSRRARGTQKSRSSCVARSAGGRSGGGVVGFLGAVEPVFGIDLCLRVGWWAVVRVACDMMMTHVTRTTRWPQLRRFGRLLGFVKRNCFCVHIFSSTLES